MEKLLYDKILRKPEVNKWKIQEENFWKK